MKFTKGPWIFADGFWNDGDKESPLYGKSKYLNEPVAIIPHDDVCEKGEKEVRANALLIAAAPDLYEACKFVSERLQEWANGLDVAGDSSSSMALQGLADDLKTALAKAEAPE